MLHFLQSSSIPVGVTGGGRCSSHHPLRLPPNPKQAAASTTHRTRTCLFPQTRWCGGIGQRCSNDIDNKNGGTSAKSCLAGGGGWGERLVSQPPAPTKWKTRPSIGRAAFASTSPGVFAPKEKSHCARTPPPPPIACDPLLVDNNNAHPPICSPLHLCLKKLQKKQLAIISVCTIMCTHDHHQLTNWFPILTIMGRAIFVVPKNGSCLLLCLSGFWSSEQYGFLP